MGKDQGYHQVTLNEWLYWKEDIRDKLRETAGNFVYIGYRLKQIRDSGMYGGAADIFEFAQKEYGLGKSTVSRFIAINEKFSEGGNSLELKAEYRDIGSSKLSEMLTLPDAECSLITERTTVKEIRELKSFLRQQAPEEEQETDGAEGSAEKPAETAGGQEESREMPGRDPEPQEGLSPLQKCLVEYFRDRKELLNDVMPLIYADRHKRAAELMNPSGYCTYQKGMVFLFMYDFDKGVKYKVFGSPNIQECSWEDFLQQTYAIYGGLYEAGEDDIHGAYYKTRETQEKAPEKLPEKTPETEKENTGKARQLQALEDSVATSQQSQESQGEKEKTAGGAGEHNPEEQLPESKYEEIAGETGSTQESQEEKDGSRIEGTGGGETDTREPEGTPGKEEAVAAGDAAAVSGGIPAGSQVPGPDEGAGAAPGGGCETDPWEKIKSQSLGEMWEEIIAAESSLHRFIYSWKGIDPAVLYKKDLEEAYKDAIDLAAALEKLMIAGDADGKIDHAQ